MAASTMLGRGLACLALVLAAAAILAAARGFPPQDARRDSEGEPLPPDAVARIGSSRLRHGEEIKSVAFSGDGSKLLTCGPGHLKIWSAATGKLLHHVRAGDDGRMSSFQPAAAAFHPDDATIDWVSNPSKGLGSRLVHRVVSSVNGQVLSEETITGPMFPRGLDLQPRADLLAVWSGGDEKAYVFSLEERKKLGSLEVKPPKDVFSEEKRLAVSPKGDLVAYFPKDGGLAVRSLKEKKNVFAVPDQEFLAFTFSPSGDRLAAMAKDRALRVWETERFTPTLSMDASDDFAPYVVFFGPGDTLFAWARFPAAFHVIDVKAKKTKAHQAAALRRVLPSLRPLQFAAAPGGKVLAALAEGNMIALWDLEKGQWRPESGDTRPVDLLRFAAGGTEIVASVGDEASRYAARTGAPLGPLAKPAGPSTQLIDEAADARVLLYAGKDGRLCVRDAAGNSIATEARARRVTARLSRDGSRFVTADSGVCVWDAATGKQLCRCEGRYWVREATFSADGHFVLGADYARDGPAHVWDAATGKVVGTLKPNDMMRAPPTWSPTENLVAYFELSMKRLEDDHAAIVLWSPDPGMPERRLTLKREWIKNLAFSADGRMLAVPSEPGNIVFWEVASRQVRHVIVGHETQVTKLAFAPAGKLLAAQSEDAPIFVWELPGAIAPLGAVTDADLESLWRGMGAAEAKPAFVALRKLAGAGDAAAEFLKARLRPAAGVSAEEKKAWIEGLADASFQKRAEAAAAIEKCADQFVAELANEAKNPRSPESRRLATDLLEKATVASDEPLRALRAIEALELAATPKAAELLKELAKGAPVARITRAAALAVNRLTPANP